MEKKELEEIIVYCQRKIERAKDKLFFARDKKEIRLLQGVISTNEAKLWRAKRELSDEEICEHGNR